MLLLFKTIMSLPVLFLLLVKCATLHGEKSKIAIIGGGIGGTSAAHKLTELALAHGLEIEMDLYEAEEVGGRLATASVNGMEFEMGGSIIHDSNRYMATYVDKLNLAKRDEADVQKHNNFMGFYDGNEFVYVDSQYRFVSKIAMWWRYGMDPLRLEDEVLNPFLESFEKIYQLQGNNETFSDVHSLLDSLNPSFVKLLNVSIQDCLLSDNYNKLFVKELGFIATKVNYNQDLDIHAFVGAVALAGSCGKLWSVEGGNKLVPNQLLLHSDARLVQKTVKSVVLLPSSKYALEVGDKEDDGLISYTSVYDYVIIATPLFQESKNNIEFRGFPGLVLPDIRYKKTVATLVQGSLNYSYFNYHGSYEHAPNQIFPTTRDVFYSAVCVVYPVTPDEQYEGNVFKIFSEQILTQNQLDLLFLNHELVSVKDWFAYPVYSTVPKNVAFELHENLFYVNAIEWAASAMEMSALSGVNSALLVLEKIQRNSN